MIKVLHIASSLEYGGGVQTLLFNYYKNMDKDEIAFDFIVHGEKIGGYEEWFKQKGSAIFHVTPKKKSFIKNVKEINEVLSAKDYDIVHVHQNLSSGIALLLAKIHGVPVRISHSHGYHKSIGNLQLIKEAPFRLINNMFSNYKFACSIEAGKWLFGKKWSLNDKNRIIYNAIDLDRFTFDSEIRNKYRNLFNLNNSLTLLQVGRLADEKNQLFSLKVLKELLLKERDAVLLFAGSGNMEDKLKEIAESQNLNNHVLFLGNRQDIPELMNAADMLLLPSKNEGLGMAAIEAQACGLRVLASEFVPTSTKLTNLIDYLPFDVHAWTEKIISHKQDDRIKPDQNIFSDYAINIQAKKYEDWLLNLKRD